MEIVETKVVRTETTHRVELTAAKLRKIFEREGITLPRDATIRVQVPGGGDWSNTELDIDDRCPVVVQWTEVEVK